MLRSLRPLLLTVLATTYIGLAGEAAPVQLQPGDKAPDFRLTGSDGKEYQLSEFLGRKAVVLMWFPRAGSQGAKDQCAGLQAVMAAVPADRVQVFGCSTAAVDVTTAFAQAGQYSFPILSDADRVVAPAYGCLRSDGLSERYLFVIDEQGLIAAVNRNTSPQTAGADLLRMLADKGLLGAATAPAAPVAAAAARGDQLLTVPVGTLARTCWLHLPPTYDGVRKLPVVIALHGARGNGKGMAGMTGFGPMGDANGFIAAYPDGIAGDHTWNALFGKIPGGEGVLADDVDDVAFLRALIERLCAEYHADPSRVFVCGYSAGAYMAYRAAVELADLVAAVGIVNGSLGIKSLDGKPCGATIPTPAAPVSVIHICGKQDSVVKFGGAQTPKNLYRSVPDCLRFFVEANGCNATGQDTLDVANDVARTLYPGGKSGTEVKLVVVGKANHSWPLPAQGLATSRELWDFFAAHPKASPAGNAGVGE